MFKSNSKFQIQDSRFRSCYRDSNTPSLQSYPPINQSTIYKLQNFNTVSQLQQVNPPNPLLQGGIALRKLFDNHSITLSLHYSNTPTLQASTSSATGTHYSITPSLHHSKPINKLTNQQTTNLLYHCITASQLFLTLRFRLLSLNQRIKPVIKTMRINNPMMGMNQGWYLPKIT